MGCGTDNGSLDFGGDMHLLKLGPYLIICWQAAGRLLLIVGVQLFRGIDVSQPQL